MTQNEIIHFQADVIIEQPLVIAIDTNTYRVKPLTVGSLERLKVLATDLERDNDSSMLFQYLLIADNLISALSNGKIKKASRLTSYQLNTIIISQLGSLNVSPLIDYYDLENDKQEDDGPKPLHGILGGFCKYFKCSFKDALNMSYANFCMLLSTIPRADTENQYEKVSEENELESLIQDLGI